MNGSIRPDLYNLVMIGLIGFAAVWGINKGLSMAGLSKYSTSGS
jgi:hypothetical protein